MSLMGFLIDAGVSAGVTGAAAAMRATPVGWGVAVVGGAAGGIVGQWYDDGAFSIEGTVEGAASGALGGLLGGWGAKAVGKGLEKWSKNASAKIDDLKNPAALKKADEDLTKVRDELNSVNSRLNDPNISSSERAQLEQKRLRLETEEDRLGDASKSLREKAGESDAVKNAEANKKRIDWLKDSNIPFVSLVSLGSALSRAGWNAYNSSAGTDGGGGGDGDGQSGGTPVELAWAGQAAAGGLMGTAPFVPSPVPSNPAQGMGFLLHPVELDRIVVAWYGGASGSFASSLADNYKAFGDIENKEDLSITPIPKVPVFSSISESSEGGANYGQVAQGLNTSAEALNEKQASLAGVVEKVEDISRTGKENVGYLIAGVNSAMNRFPPGNIDTDFLSLLNQAIGDSTKIMDDAIAQYRLAAGTIEDPGQNSIPSGQDLANAVGQLDNGMNNSALRPDALTTPTLPDAATPGGPGDSGPHSELEQAVDQLEQAGGAAPPGSGGMDPSGGMMNSLMSSMLPMMMQQAMMRNSADSDLASRRSDIDPARYDRDRAMTAPATQPATTPWSGKQGAATAATPQQPQTQPHGSPGSGTTSSQTGGAPPRTPGANGSIVYTFPDGRTQKVSPTVASVLDKAFANIKGTDAQEAYADTDAKWTDQKEIGSRVDPFQLMTGDVATWDDRTAVVVAFGAGEEGTLEAIVNGELQEFAPEMSDSAGEFGQFTGFVHPPGIGLGESTGKAGDSGAAPGDQQSANQGGDMPLAAAPA